jgi:hypothetical protein
MCKYNLRVETCLVCTSRVGSYVRDRTEQAKFSAPRKVVGARQSAPQKGMDNLNQIMMGWLRSLDNSRSGPLQGMALHPR